MKKMLLAASSALALLMLFAGTAFAAEPTATAPISAATGQGCV